MKRIMLLLCVIYATDSFSMHPLQKAAGMGLLASPVIAAGSYYYKQAKAERGSVYDRWLARELFREFKKGAVIAVVPGVNICYLIVRSGNMIEKKVTDLLDLDPEMKPGLQPNPSGPIDRMEKARQERKAEESRRQNAYDAGFFSTAPLSGYLMLRMMLRTIRL